MSELPQGGEQQISPDLDIDVAETLKGRIFARPVRLGALAVSAAAGYVGERMHLNTVEWVGAMLPGMALNIGVGVKLSVERAAALARLRQRLQSPDGTYGGNERTEGDMTRMYRAATFGGALAANTLATLGGAVYASYAAGTPREGVLLAVSELAYLASAASQVAAEVTVNQTGATFVETPPDMHQHLFGTGEHYGPFNFDHYEES